MPLNYIIVGGSAAGMAAAHTIRKADKHGIITVLTDEKYPPYFRPMIPYIISGKKQTAELTMSGRGMFTQKDINIQTGTRVLSVDTKEQSLADSSGKIRHWDKILFATGSRPYMPENIPGIRSKGVYALKTIADAANMAERVQKTEHAVLLGGGILNMKAAFALLEKNIRVSMIVHSDEILSQLMESEDTLLLRDAFNRAGLHIIPQCSAAQILSNDSNDKGVNAVVLNNGKELPCQMICVGKGVIPATDFLANSGIHTDNGIHTDIYTACNLKNTYAAGDVALIHNSDTGEQISGALWTHAVEMGVCAGLNMTGIKTKYTGMTGIMNASQLGDTPFVAIGCVHTKDKDLEVHTVKTSNSYKKLVINKQGNKLIGVLFIGDISKAGLYQLIIREKRDISSIKNALIRHKLQISTIITPENF